MTIFSVAWHRVVKIYQSVLIIFQVEIVKQISERISEYACHRKNIYSLLYDACMDCICIFDTEVMLYLSLNFLEKRWTNRNYTNDTFLQKHDSRPKNKYIIQDELERGPWIQANISAALYEFFINKILDGDI